MARTTIYSCDLCRERGIVKVRKAEYAFTAVTGNEMPPSVDVCSNHILQAFRTWIAKTSDSKELRVLKLNGSE